MRENRGLNYKDNYLCYDGYCFSTLKGCVYFLCVLWVLHLNWFFRAFNVLVSTLKTGGNVKGDNRYQKEK
jgi:hypothetical protein